MKLWPLFILFGCFPVCLAGRKCEFLANPRHSLAEKVGEVRGTVQNCAETDCCVGYFKLVNGQPRPERLGCNEINMPCPESSCSASTHSRNFTQCVCNSDFCNANLSWSPAKTDAQLSTHLDVKTKNTVVVVILLGPLLVLVAVLGWRYLFGDSGCRCFFSKEKPPSSIEGLTISLCSHDRPETPDLDLAKMELQQMVGHGHFASVWQGYHQGASVAVKVYPGAHKHTFVNERKVFDLPLMDHFGVVHFLEAGRDLRTGEWALVLELAEHGSLNSFLSQNTNDFVSSMRLAQTLSQGLAFLHSDIYRNGVHKPAVAHCDLSSSNVLVRADGTCALCDFGCSTVLHSYTGQFGWCQHRETLQPGARVGTLRYMSPEILEGCVNLSSGWCLMQGDVYAMGLLLWEVWTRCWELYARERQGALVPEHRLPYEGELGHSPSLEELILVVSERRERPLIPRQWGHHFKGFSAMKEILEDCWDQDPDARLTARCAADRLITLGSNAVNSGDGDASLQPRCCTSGLD